MFIKNLVEYYRSLANRHQNVACYKTGENYELNQSGLSYPLVHLNTDVLTSYSSTDGLLDAEYVFVTFRLSVITFSREAYDKTYGNEIKLQGTTTKQNLDLDATHKILSELVAKSVEDFNENFDFGFLLTDRNGGTSLKRIINDDCDGWYVELQIKAHNTVICTYQDVFGSDIIDEGENKTEYQQPINENPIA